MKKISFILLLGLSLTSARAQQVSDAIKYAQEDLTGTARYRAMSGAFGALGGDLSAINVNPAGSAIFSNNFVSISLSNYNQKNKSNYFGNKTSANNSSIDMNQ